MDLEAGFENPSFLRDDIGDKRLSDVIDLTSASTSSSSLPTPDLNYSPDAEYSEGEGTATPRIMPAARDSAISSVPSPPAAPPSPAVRLDLGQKSAHCRVYGNQGYCVRLGNMHALIANLRRDARLANMTFIDPGDMQQKHACEGMIRELNRMIHPDAAAPTAASLSAIFDGVSSAAEVRPGAATVEPALLEAFIRMNHKARYGGQYSAVHVGAADGGVDLTPVAGAVDADVGFLGAALPAAVQPIQRADFEISVDESKKTAIILRTFDMLNDDGGSGDGLTGASNPRIILASVYVQGQTREGTVFETRGSSTIELLAGILTTRLVTDQLSPFFPITMAIGMSRVESNKVAMISEEVGGTLTDLVRRGTPEQLESVCVQLMLALGAMGCAAGMVHNDLHSGNVLVADVPAGTEPHMLFVHDPEFNRCLYECESGASPKLDTGKQMYRIPLSDKRVSIIDFGMTAIKTPSGKVLLSSDSMALFDPDKACNLLCDLLLVVASIYTINPAAAERSPTLARILRLPIQCNTVGSDRANVKVPEGVKIIMRGTFKNLLDTYAALYNRGARVRDLPHISFVVKCVTSHIPFSRVLLETLEPYRVDGGAPAGRIVYPVIYPRRENILFDRAPQQDMNDHVDRIVSSVSRLSVPADLYASTYYAQNASAPIKAMPKVAARGAQAPDPMFADVGARVRAYAERYYSHFTLVNPAD